MKFTFDLENGSEPLVFAGEQAKVFGSAIAKLTKRFELHKKVEKAQINRLIYAMEKEGYCESGAIAALEACKGGDGGRPVNETSDKDKAPVMQTPSMALHAVDCLLESGFVTHGNQWVERSAGYHANRAEAHLTKWWNDDTTEDHLLHAGCRMLMAWEQDKKDGRQSRCASGCPTG